MGRFQKGSAEAKEWAKKMREARGKKVSGGAVAPPSRMPETSPAAEMSGGKIGKKAKKDFDKLTRGLSKAGKATQYANPMMWAIKDKDTSDLMAQSGDLAYNYILPAVVDVGRPVLDVATGAVSTALTGNPFLGKAAGDLLFDEMVAKKGYDPRERQKSEKLGEIGRLSGRLGAVQMKKKIGKGLGAGFRTGEYRPEIDLSEQDYPTYSAEASMEGSGVGKSIPFDMRQVPDDVFREMIKGLTEAELKMLHKMPDLTPSQRGIITLMFPPPEVPNAPRVVQRKKMSGRGMCEEEEDDCMECDRCQGMGIVSVSGMGMGWSKPKKIVPIAAPQQPQPTSHFTIPPARPIPKLGRAGALPEMSAEERHTYDIMIEELRPLDRDELESDLEGELHRYHTRETSGWGRPYDVGTFIALLKALYEKR